MDTVTLVRSAVRGLLEVADPELEAQPRGLLAGADDYASPGKPPSTGPTAARAQLVDALAREPARCRRARGPPGPAVAEAAALLATVVGQDLEQDTDGVFRIARKVAADRVISTVDPEARHGHKTSARGFDGYKGHVAVDPDSEIVLATTVTAGNRGDAAAASGVSPTKSWSTRSKPPRRRRSPPRLLGRLASAHALLTVDGDSAYGTGPLLASQQSRRTISRNRSESAASRCLRSQPSRSLVDATTVILLHVFRQEPREEDAVVLIVVGPQAHSGPSYTTAVDANIVA